MTKLRPGNKVLFLTIFLLFGTAGLMGAPRYSVATGNWGSTSTWSATSGGAGGASVPVAGDDVFIEGGLTVTINVASVCRNLSVANGSTLIIGGFNLTVNGTTLLDGTISHAGLAGAKVFIGLLTVNGSGIWDNNIVNAPISFRGGISNAGSFNAGTGLYTFNTSNQVLTGTVSIPNVTITGVTLTNNGSLTVSSALGGNGGLTQGINSTLNLEGTSAITTLTAANNGNTVNYSGADQQVKISSYFNLTISGSGNKTISGNTTVSGTLNLTAGTLTVGANTLTLNGPTIAGTPANLITTAASNLVFGGTTAGVMIPSSVVAIGGLSITNTSIVTLESSPVVSGVFNPAGAGLSLGSNTLTLNGIINCGTLVGGATSNIIIGGAGAASLPGVTLNNLTVSRAVSMCGNVNVLGTLTLTAGAFSIAANTLDLSDGATLSYGGGTLTGGVTSNLTIGTGANITLNAVAGGLNNFTTSRNIILGAGLSLNGTLTLTAGTFSIGANTLTLNGPTIAGTPANLITTAASNLVFGGTTAGVMIPSSVVAIGGLSITNTNIVTLQSSPIVSGTFNPAGSGLSLGSNTLTLNGVINCGTLVGGATSNIIIGGAGAASLPGVTLNNFTVSRAVSMCGNVNVLGTLTLTSGALSIAANTLSLSDGATLSYGGGTLTGGVSSNLTMGTGADMTLNAVAGGLNNFTINRNITLGTGLSLNGTLTLSAGILTVGANTLTLNGPAIAGVPGNLAAIAASSLSFGGSSAGVFIPANVTNLNNLIINNANGVTINSNLTLGVGGVLTLANGILQTGTNTLKITNTNPATAIVWTPGSFVNITSGSVERTLTANLSGTGNNYLFPIGESGVFKGINLRDVNTGATGPVLRASVNASGALTGDGTTLTTVDPRYWSLLNLNSGNLTSAKVELYESGLGFSKTIGMSSAIAGDYSAIGGSSNTTSVISPSVLNPGPYFCIGESLSGTYYSYKTGDWNTPDTWTSDPSGTLQIGTTVPGNNAKVIILPGRTVSLDANIATINLDITIDDGGFLDQRVYMFTNGIYALRGSGTLMLSSASFPTPVITNTFVTSEGGTTEYNAAVTMPASQATYYHLTIRTAGTVIQRSNITLNGSLNVKQGKFQINDATAQRLKLVINGNITVDNGASIAVGTGVTNTVTNPVGINGTTGGYINYYELHSHRIEVYGDFTNNGTVKFTNLTYPVYNSFPPLVNGTTTGFATVYFNGLEDKALTCNGQTDFYNLVINKGSNQTFKLTIYSSAYNNFRLFGANTSAGDNTAPATTANPNLKKALWVRGGTLILRGLTVIPSLSEGATAGPPSSDFTIPSQSAIIMDGAGVIVLSTADDYREVNGAYGVAAPDNTAMGINTTAGNSGLSVLGKLQINDGYLSTRESAGILYWPYAPGQIVMNGGTLDAKQFHSSSLANSLIAYTQTAGTMLLRGRFQRTTSTFTPAGIVTAPLNNVRAAGGVDATSGSFSITNSGGANGFAMSGGSIRIFDVCGTVIPTYAFHVLCSTADINVTGGTVELLPTSGSLPANDADYFINSSAQFGELIINRISGTTAVQLSAFPVKVLNNLTLTAGVFTANNLDVTVGGDLTIAGGTIYNAGTNNTILNGTGEQNFYLYADQTLNNLTLNKSAGMAVNFAGTSGTVVNISGNMSVVLGTLNDNGNTLNVAGNLYNSGITAGSGKITLNGTNPQTIDGNGIYGNLELNNTNAAAAPISLLAGMTVNGDLTFSQNKIFNIRTYNLKLNGSATIVNGGDLRYFQSAGNNGDGGVTKVFSTPGTFLFPLGVVNYTPATITLNSAPTAYGSITVIPVNYAHPNVTISGNGLTYYWHVLSSGFTLGSATISQSYSYNQVNVITGAGVTENEYVPSRFDNATNSWSKGTLSDIDITNNIIGEPNPGTYLSNVTFIDGDYTAGDDSPVDPFGTLRILYSRQTGLWSNVNSWSLTGHAVNNPPATPPSANDIVIIGGNDSIYLPTNLTLADQGKVNCATLQIEKGSALDVGFNPGSNFGRVINHPGGNGNFRLTTNQTTNSTFAFPAGDFSDYNINMGTTELYTTNGSSGTVFYMPNNASSYGNLILSPLGGSNLIFGNLSVTIYGDLITRGQNADSWFCPSWGNTYPGSVAAVAKTITINGKMDIQGGALIWYSNGAIPENFVIGGDVKVSTLSSLFVYTGATNQSMTIGGSLINNANGLTNAPSSTQAKVDFTNIAVTFNGPNSAKITSTLGTPLTIFSNVTVNKGSSQATSLTCDIAGTLTTPANAWLTLTNGTFRYTRTNPTTDFTISTITPFSIPATAGLFINLPNNINNKNILIGAAANNNGDLLLQGALTIVNGNVYVGNTAGTDNSNNDIEYSTSGASAINIEGGLLFVNGQIRRNPSNASGILKYRQTGGTVTVNGQAFANSNAKFEVVNTGSIFNMTNGTLNIVRGNGATTTPSSSFGDLYLRPDSSSVTGGTIVFSNNGLTGPHNYYIDATVPIYNLNITGVSAANYAAVRVLASPLTLNGNLLINANSVLNSNNINTTFNGNFTNIPEAAGYIPGINTTTFSVTNASPYSGVQSLTGTTSFYDLIVAPGTSLSLNAPIIVDSDLTIETGSLICNGNAVNLKGDLVNQSSYTDNNTAGSGVHLNGTILQHITGTGAFARLTLNNPSGAEIENDIELQEDITLTTGILNLQKNVLTLGLIANISGGPFSVTKMIITDGVYSTGGLRKYFNTGATGAFTYPIGIPGKYTPAVLTITGNNTVGYVQVNTVNSIHPGVTDATNALKYYWQVQSSGVTNLDGSLVTNYLQSDVNGVQESSYIAARLIVPGTTWVKTAGVDPDLNKITYNFTASNNLGGEYTAGLFTAFPNNVPEYSSNADGNWSDNLLWTQTGGDPYPCPVGGPNGFIVTINHEVTLDGDNCTAYRTTINNRLKVVLPFYRHNLGTVTGNGTLYLESGTFPAGIFTAFLSCGNNSTVEYGGTGTYTIIADLYSTVPRLYFTGTGSRILPDKDLTVCTQLKIDGPIVDNSVYNRRLTIQGTMERYNTGGFISGTGAEAIVAFNGSAAQTVGGVLGDFTGTSAFNNLEINNTSGLIVNTGSGIEVKNNLMLTNGLITTSSTASLTLSNTSINSVIPAGGSTTSFVSGPLIKIINQYDDFLFPIGTYRAGIGNILGNKLKVSSTQSGPALWTAEYINPNSTSTSAAAPLLAVSAQEYWTVKVAAASQSVLNINWTPTSDITPLVAGSLSNMRLANYNTGTGQWIEIPTISAGDNYNGTAISSSLVSSTGSDDYTLGSITELKPKVKFSPTGPVCGIAGIPVTFTAPGPIPFDYVLNYTVNGSAQAPITITSGMIPYTLPTPVSGVYVLTGFKYNNGAGNGSVDITPITVSSTPTTSNGGPDQAICGITTATLAGNTPAVGTGLWTIVNGGGGNIITPTSPTSQFIGLNGVVYTLRWTITNGLCLSTDDVIINFTVQPNPPAAVSPQSLCASNGPTIASLTVTPPPACTVDWYSAASGGTPLASGMLLVNNTTYYAESKAGTCVSLTRTPVLVNLIPDNTVSLTSAPGTDNQTGCINNPILNITYVTSGATGATITGLPAGVNGDWTANVVTISGTASTAGTFNYTVTLTGGCGLENTSGSITITANTIWTGAISTDWNIPGNWSCGGVPVSVTSVVIPNVTNNPVIGAGATASVNNLTINPGGSLTVSGNTIQIAGAIINNGMFAAANGTIEMNGTAAQVIGSGTFIGNTIRDLTISNNAGVALTGHLKITGIVTVNSGNLSSSGNLTLLSKATGTALISGSGAGTVTGNVTMERYLPSLYGYRYFSSPFQTSTVNEFADDMALGPFTIFRYDENRTSSGWVDYDTPLTNPLIPLQGYAINFGDVNTAGTVDLTGEVNDGNLSVTLFNHNYTYTKGFSLAGNPYPSPIDWDAPSGWTKTNIDNALYFFNASTTDQYGGTYNSYINGISTDGIVDNIIPSMQGFLVHVSDGAWPVTGTLALNNSVRITNLNHAFAKSVVSYPVPMLRLRTGFDGDPASTDPAIIYFDENATSDFDSELDALKLLNTDFNVANLYAIGSDGSKLSISALPPLSTEFLRIPLGVKLNKEGSVFFKISEIDESLAGRRIYISDLVTGINQDLLPDVEYRLSLGIGEYNNRFFLNFSNIVTKTNDIILKDDLFNIYSYHGKIKADISNLEGKGVLKIYNLTGQMLYITTIYQNGYHEFDPGLKDGIYIVRYTSGSQVNTRKIHIKN